MKPTIQDQDPAFPVMAMDIFTTVLNRADNPAAVGQYLAEEIREITGASCVVFLQTQLGEDGAQSRVFSYHPPRRQIWLESPEGRQLINSLAETEFVERLSAEEDSDRGRLLEKNGYNRCLALPLRVGYFKVGVLLLLGLQSRENDNRVENLLSTLSTLVALVLRNAFLYEQQELTIAERSEELRTTNDALRLTQFSIDSARDAIFWLMPDGSFAFHNRSAAALLGVDPGDLNSRKLQDFLVSPAPETWNFFWTELRRSKAKSSELLLRRNKGEDLPVEVSATHVAFGNHEYCCAIVRDLTERRRLEAQLVQAQKMEAIGLLAGGIAHDFNNILAAMLLQVGLLRSNSCLDEETQSALTEITEGAKRAADMTKQLLMFSRRSVLSPQAIRLDHLAANLSKMLRRLIGENIELSLETEDNLPLVNADPRMIELVVMNLAINARDAMPKGGALSIKTCSLQLDSAAAEAKSERRPGRFVRLSVQDSGTGMDEITIQRIFEPFFTTKEQGKGTGLGLATVQSIVSQHRGWLEVESQLGKGSCFHAYLEASHSDVLPQEPAPVETPSGGTEGILLVEDEVPLRIAAAACLRQAGYQVLTAATGNRALELWEKTSESIELVITDMIMPEGMTGLELAQRILEKRPATKIILTSGYHGTGGDVDAVLQKGVVYLPKPYDVHELGIAVRRALDRTKAPKT